MNLVQAALLGIVQGFTEFLPVSSSGHLVIVTSLFRLPPNVPFDILLHVATLLAVCVFFISDIIKIISAFLFDRKMDNPYFKLGLLAIVASIPTAIIGFALNEIFEAMFSSTLYVGCFLILTGVLIMLAETLGKAEKKEKKVSFIDALIIGTAQGCAVAPGLSRSGTTISASLLRGLDRKLAARFSFLLSIPAILGATIFKVKHIVHIINLTTLTGFAFAAVTGYIAIAIFMGLIQKHSIKVFAYYCFVVGILSIILGLAH